MRQFADWEREGDSISGVSIQGFVVVGGACDPMIESGSICSARGRNVDVCSNSNNVGLSILSIILTRGRLIRNEFLPKSHEVFV